jgi:predicted TIM-barrel fold metal-dependent hydrolase
MPGQQQRGTDEGGYGYADPHFHLWHMQANYYPWLTDRPLANPVFGEYSALRKNYLVADFLADAGDVPLVKGVHIEADHDESDPVRETRWLQGIADRPDSRGFPHGIVAYANLALDVGGTHLREHAEFANVRGVRQTGRGLPAQLLEHATFLRNFRLLGKLGLSYDLRVPHHDMGTAGRLARTHPGTQFIVTHTGYRMSEEPGYVADWRRGMQGLAMLSNVAVKLSGFGFMNPRWTVDWMRPLVLETIDMFGADRCMFATNFPVDKLMRDCTAYWRAYEEITRSFSADERLGLFRANAERIYRV